MKQRFLIGTDLFSKHRVDNAYFVDKSLLISDILNGSDVTLLPRPRRFGKTLGLIMRPNSIGLSTNCRKRPTGCFGLMLTRSSLQTSHDKSKICCPTLVLKQRVFTSRGACISWDGKSAGEASFQFGFYDYFGMGRGAARIGGWTSMSL